MASGPIRAGVPSAPSSGPSWRPGWRSPDDECGRGGQDDRHAGGQDRRGQQGDEDGEHGGGRGVAAAQARPEEGDEGGGSGGIQTERARVAEGVAEQGAGEGGEVPQHEHGKAGLPEPESLRAQLGLGDADRGRLVDGELGGHDPAHAADAEEARGLQAVEPVADAEHRCRRDRRRRRAQAAGADDADEGELRAAGEHQQRQQLRLPEVEPGRDGERAEADAVGAAGDADAPGLPDDLAAAGVGQGRLVAPRSASLAPSLTRPGPPRGRR